MKATIRFAALLIAALLAFVGVASADRAVVRDQKRETAALKRKPRMDITRALAGHRGKQVKHTVVMRRRVKPGRKSERPLIGINSRGGSRSDPEFLVLGSAVFKVREDADPRRVAPATLRTRKRRWIYRFDPTDLGLTEYGWVAISTKGGAFDTAPSSRYKQHELR